MFIVKVPGVNNFEKNWLGYSKTGDLILKVLKEKIGSNESGDLIDFGKLDLEEIHLDNSDLITSNKLIYKNAFEIYESKPRTIFLGGDNSISYSLIRAFFDHCQNLSPSKEPCLICFNSRYNLINDKKDSSKQNFFPSNRGWIRSLVEDKFPIKNILLVGARNLLLEEKEFFEKSKFKVISLNSLLTDIEETCDIIMEFSNKKELYVSINIGIVDCAFAPATEQPIEPGGLTSRQLIYLIQRINKMRNLRGVDIVGINKEKDKKFEYQTVNLGAKVLSELIC